MVVGLVGQPPSDIVIVAAREPDGGGVPSMGQGHGTVDDGTGYERCW